MPADLPRKSKLIVAGVIFLAAAILLPRPLAQASNAAPDYGSRVLLAILSDIFAACFFVSIGCFIIGGMRNRRWRKEAELQKSPPQ